MHFNGARIVAFDCLSFTQEVEDKCKGEGTLAWSRRLASVDVVFFDDLGKAKMTDRVEAELFALFERRAANMKPTIVTTNLAGRDWRALFSKEKSDPFLRRLREFCEAVKF